MGDVEKYMQDKSYWAHTCEGKLAETLGEHSHLCLEYYDKYCAKKSFDQIVKRILCECGCGEIEVELVYKWFVEAVYWHDIGKINPVYQWKVLKNKKFKSSQGSSKHSLLSACVYLREHVQQLQELPRASRKKLSYFLYGFAYVIACHHGYLKDIKVFTDQVQQCMEAKEFYDQELFWNKNYLAAYEEKYDRLKRLVSDEVAFYVLIKLLFAVVVSCDFWATSEYMSGTSIEIHTIDNVAELKKKYQSGSIYDFIQSYKQNQNLFAGTINSQRCKIFLETENNLLSNPKSMLYYLEAPTGSGKTNMSINLTLHMLEQNKAINNVFYIFPFNTLVEQTAQVLESYFSYGEEIAVINSITPTYLKEGNEEVEKLYEEATLNRNFNNYPIVITSHVNFFNALFGTGREQNFPLIKLCNSVVIIDEIQSYRNKIWHQIILFLMKYAKLLNMRVIIMSATLPKLDLLLGEEAQDVVDLITNPQVYYQNPLFKNRVEIDFSLLAYKKIDLEELRSRVLEHKDKKVLVEFISKTTAREFFTMINGYSDCVCVEITGDDNIRNRKAIIEQVKGNSPIIVIATQVIEAGVDIDMDIGFKDISLPDAEEQFLGRINRSCSKSNCKAYFFNYDDASKIYGDDVRVNYSIEDQSVAKMVQEKNFGGIYDSILQAIKKKNNSKNRDNIHYTYKQCLELLYQEIAKTMRLIDPSKQIFLAHEMIVENQILDGRNIWKRYKQLCTDKLMPYGQKKVLLSQLAETMSYFTYTVYSRDEREISCDEEFGSYYYIENGQEFITDGKFDRKKFNQHAKGLFL